MSRFEDVSKKHRELDHQLWKYADGISFEDATFQSLCLLGETLAIMCDHLDIITNDIINKKLCEKQTNK